MEVGNDQIKLRGSYVYWTVHHLDSWIKRDQLDATCFIITLFSAQHVSDVNTPILRSLRLIRWVISWVVSGSMCVGVTLQCGYGGVVSVCNLVPTHFEPDTTHEITQRIICKLLRMGVLTSETCWALNKVIIKQVASSWSLFTQHLSVFHISSNTQQIFYTGLNNDMKDSSHV